MQHYEQPEVYTLLQQFNTKVVFRTEDPLIIKMICEAAGTLKVKTINKGISFGAHEMRDGVSFQDHEKEIPALTANDLLKLENLEFYLIMPATKAKITKSKIEYVEGKWPVKNKGSVPTMVVTHLSKKELELIKFKLSSYLQLSKDNINSEEREGADYE